MHGAHRPIALQVDGVSKGYGTGDARTAVLESVDLLIHDEEKVSLVGPSGSGKSTLLSLIAGLTAPDAGQVSIGGLALQRPRRHRPCRDCGPSRWASSSSRAI